MQRASERPAREFRMIARGSRLPRPGPTLRELVDSNTTTFMSDHSLGGHDAHYVNRNSAEDETPVAEAVSSRFGKDAIIAFAANIVFALLGLANGILIARSLGPEGKGEYNAVILWPLILGWVGLLGLFKANTYYRAKEPEKAGFLFANSIWVSLATGIVLVTIGQLSIPRLLGSYNKAVVSFFRIGLCLLPFVSLFVHVQSLIMGAKDFVSFCLVRITQPTICLGVLLILLATGRFTLKNAVWAYILAQLAGLAVGMLFLSKTCPLRFLPDYETLAVSLRYGLRYYGAQLSEIAMTNLGTIILIPALGATNLGLFTVAKQAQFLTMLALPASFVLLPNVASCSEREGEMLTAKAFRIFLPIFLLASLVLLRGGHYLIGLLYGPDFLSAVGPFRVLLIGFLAYGLFLLLSEGLNGLGLPQYVTYAQVTCFGTMSVLFWVLIPVWNLMGAALAMAIAYWIGLSLVFAVFVKVSRLSIAKLLFLRKSDIKSVLGSVKSIVAKR